MIHDAQARTGLDANLTVAKHDRTKDRGKGNKTVTEERIKEEVTIPVTLNLKTLLIPN